MPRFSNDELDRADMIIDDRQQSAISIGEPDNVRIFDRAMIEFPVVNVGSGIASAHFKAIAIDAHVLALALNQMHQKLLQAERTIRDLRQKLSVLEPTEINLVIESVWGEPTGPSIDDPTKATP